MRRLIINADDFGMTTGVNRAIVEAHEQGMVTSATLMAQGQAFHGAIECARSLPGLAIGCHVVLVDGKSTLAAQQVPSLMDGSPNDMFETNLNRFAWRAITDRVRADEIEAEASAQIRKLQSNGIVVSHIDTHKHTHIFPQVLRPVLRAARTCGVRAVRNPFERLHFLQVVHHPRSWIRFTKFRLLYSLANAFRRITHDAGMNTTDGAVGILATGVLDLDALRSICDSLPEGTWELVCHPGYNDNELRGVRTRLRESREVELRLLTSCESRKILGEKGIELISYRDLA